MQINELQPKHKNRGRKRVGRGGRKGTYSGRGMKGQKQRAGRKMVPLIRELIKRYPKLKGYRRVALDNPLEVVNLSVLEKRVQDGDVVSPENLFKKGIVGKINGKMPKVKILGAGKFTKKIFLEKCAVSKSARAAIEKAGGSIK